MKRRALHWDPIGKLFTMPSRQTLLRLLDPEEERLAQEYEGRNEVRSPEQQAEFLLYMSAAAMYKNW
jgi:hypothetical protein